LALKGTAGKGLRVLNRAPAPFIARSRQVRALRPDDRLSDEAIQISCCGSWIASLRSQ
jgi:hypothetical protein